MQAQARVWGVALGALMAGCTANGHRRAGPEPPVPVSNRVATPTPRTPYEPPPAVMPPSAIGGGPAPGASAVPPRPETPPTQAPRAGNE